MTAVERPSNGRVTFDVLDLPFSGRIGITAASVDGHGFRVLLTPADARSFAGQILAYLDRQCGAHLPSCQCSVCAP